MRLVVALGGNALLRSGEPMTSQNQRANVAVACEQLSRVALDHELVVCEFVERTGKTAVIGGLPEIDGLLSGSSGTIIRADVGGVTFRDGGAA